MVFLRFSTFQCPIFRYVPYGSLCVEVVFWRVWVSCGGWLRTCCWKIVALFCLLFAVSEKVGGFRSGAIGGTLVVGVLPNKRVVRFFLVRGSLKDCLGGVRDEKVVRVSGPSTSSSLRIPLLQDRYCLLRCALAKPLFVFEVEVGFLRDLRCFLFRSLPCFFFFFLTFFERG